MSIKAMLTRPAGVAQYTVGEEIANAVTHGVAALLSIAGLAVLVAFAVLYSGSPKVVAAVSIFGASMVFLYTASTLYHSIPNPRAKKVLQYLDHSMIYVLIAGSYTPFCLITLQGYTGIALLCAVWLIAIAGISLQAVLLHKADWINCLLYLSMGWLAVFVIDPLVSTLDSTGLALLVAGGLAYTVGVVFYIFERIPFSHAIWHTFVFAGTTLQFFSVLFYVIPGVNV
ncbi:hemolysin III family protein [Sutterella sp. AM11-39]|jgi:hemolysin III|uniref:PAQR family membrane homeostasis protein TrhA n=1 Tax=Sutterella sp. AM11-39 TaxID=2292075 RepID=UPI000E4F2E80|nr:hemolysin III family protein [Sutterella sp. AM11-39]RHJ34553.1 hemolysin III family protein [Sutterella sp. AM11-39]